MSGYARTGPLNRRPWSDAFSGHLAVADDGVTVWKVVDRLNDRLSYAVVKPRHPDAPGGALAMATVSGTASWADVQADSTASLGWAGDGYAALSNAVIDALLGRSWRRALGARVASPGGIGATLWDAGLSGYLAGVPVSQW